MLCSFYFLLTYLFALVTATILQNGQVRDNPYPGQATIVSVTTNSTWNSYAPDATEISYKGRWDSKYISWWSAPGLKFGFTGSNVALSFGQYTDPGVLVAWRIDGQDWQFSNVSANATYQFVSAATTGANLTAVNNTQTFELRVTNWSYGVQLTGVKTDGKLVQVAPFQKTVEIIGDSLSAGQYATYEGISSWSWGFAEGLGDAEFSITAYPGICLADTKCYGNLRGQTYQWFHTSDTSGRAIEIYGDNPETWDFTAHPAADLTVINIGTNDNNSANGVTNDQFYNSYIELIDGIHNVWPNTQIIVFSLWEGFGAVGNTYQQGAGFVTEIEDVVAHYSSGGEETFVHYFNTTGILQHNDIGPQYHPTDVGHIKIASHLLQFVKLKFGYVFAATGPEVQHDTLYWNDQQNY